MYTGDNLLTTLRMFGVWRPSSSVSQWKIWLYSAYTVFAIFFYFTYTFSFCLYLVQVADDIDIFTQTLFYSSTTFAIFIKMLNFILRYKSVTEFKYMLLDEQFQPQDSFEKALLQNVSRTCRLRTMIVQIIINTSATFVFLTSFAKKGKVSLIFKTWIPYSLDSSLAFWLTYLYQTLAILMTASITVPVECIALLIMLQICGQLEVIIHRLNFLPKSRKRCDTEFIAYQHESSIIKKCVRHHISVFSLGEKLNELFGLVIFVQFFASMTSLCCIIYQLSRMSLGSPIFWVMASYLFGIKTQMFIYCFYGDKIIEKSMNVSQTICEMDWNELTNRTKVNLVIIMIRASRPIQLTGASIITMSINSFVKIIKSAYSFYSLLKSTSEV